MKAKVSIINIGNELLLGQTVNTNLSWLGQELAAIGLPVNRSVTIQDDADEIKATLATEWQNNDVVIVTGGLGPTKDDITKAAIADFFEQKLEFRQDVWEQVQSIFSHREMPTPEINKSQAMVPERFEAFPNDRGTAPGLHFKENGKLFFALPGVPIEMKYFYSEYIRDILSETFPAKPVILKTIHTWNASESALAERLSDLVIPEGIQLAWLPQTGRLDLRIYGNDEGKVNLLFDQIISMIEDKVWGYDNETPAAVLQSLLVDKKMTLATAESCTGGLVGKMITDVPGASKYYLGSVVSYTNAMKFGVLGVNHQTLDGFGAVSIETAMEMAEGVRTQTKADLGIAVSGIAGPEGGSPEKPVGTVCFAITSDKENFVFKSVFNGDRSSIRHKAAEHILLSTIEFVRRLV
jgi:nicotinamide-nucleotide amidase